MASREQARPTGGDTAGNVDLAAIVREAKARELANRETLREACEVLRQTEERARGIDRGMEKAAGAAVLAILKVLNNS